MAIVIPEQALKQTVEMLDFNIPILGTIST